MTFEITDGHVKESVKDVLVELPPGFAGNPLATPRCKPIELSNQSGVVPGCPVASQVGEVSLSIFSPAAFTEYTPVYNMVPPHGAPAAFGFAIADGTAMLVASLRTGDDYGVNLESEGINQYLGLTGTDFILWGTPASSVYDDDRGPCGTAFVFGLCPANVPPVPLITLPGDCSAGAATTRLQANSWQDTGTIEEASFNTGADGTPLAVSGCDTVPFTPTFKVAPTTQAADSPTGLSVDLHISQDGLLSSTAIAQAMLKRTTVTLPEGMSVNPASANGLAACSAAQIELDGPNPATCPEASKIGSVEIETPILDHTVKGAVYFAKQGENKFGSLLATYIAIDDEQTGVVVKLAGKVESEPATGRLTATFDDNPQLPFEDLSVDFFSGPNAALRTPAACGTYAIKSELSSWSAANPDNPLPAEIRASSDSFQITSGPNGKPCANSFDPKLEAGTTNAVGGKYSPFVLRSRARMAVSHSAPSASPCQRA